MCPYLSGYPIRPVLAYTIVHATELTELMGAPLLSQALVIVFVTYTIYIK